MCQAFSPSDLGDYLPQGCFRKRNYPGLVCVALSAQGGSLLLVISYWGLVGWWVVMGVGALWVLTIFWQGVMEKRRSRDTRIA